MEINYLANINNLRSVKTRHLILLIASFLWSEALVGQQVMRLDFFTDEGKNLMSSQFLTDADSARILTDRLLKKKIAAGFLEAFWKIDTRSDTVQYQLVLGTNYSWVKIDGLDSLDFGSLHSNEKPIPYAEPYHWLEEWVSKQEKNGFPFAKADLQVVEMVDGKLTGRVKLDSGPLITWDSLQVKGNTRTRQGYLQRLSGILPGTPFSQDQFEQGVKKIRASPYFSWGAPPELQFRTRQAVPIFSLQDRRINVFDGIVGFLPNANEPGRLLITGQVDLRLFHLGGKGREIGFQWQKLNQQSQSLDMRFKERFVFGSPLDVEATFSLLKQDSSFVNRSFGIDFGLQVSDQTYLSFFHKRQSGDLVGVSGLSEETTLGKLIDFRWNHYGIKWDWSSLDDVESPRKGSRIQAQISVGNKRIIENTGLPQEAYEDIDRSSPQLQASFVAEKHLLIKPRYGIWLKTSGGHIQNSNLFLNELFRIGGLKSIRGFYETFFFAKSFAYLTMEHRLYLDSRSYLVAFSDLGVLTNPFASPDLDRPVSLGTGINLDTGGGLFSFVLALGRSNTQPMSFSYSRVHFGYLARF